MSVTTEAYIDFPVATIADAFEGGLLSAEEQAAIEIVNRARSNFDRKTQDLGTGEMAGDFFDFKSFYELGGWVAGVFDHDGPAWTETVGGRSHFFEYGRSAPGKGRKAATKNTPSQKSQSKSERAQPPRPFIRPAANYVKRKYGGITTKELARVAARMNRHSSVNSSVNSALRKIA